MAASDSSSKISTPLLFEKVIVCVILAYVSGLWINNHLIPDLHLSDEYFFIFGASLSVKSIVLTMGCFNLTIDMKIYLKTDPLVAPFIVSF